MKQGTTLKRRRMSADVKQADLARAANIMRQTLVDIEQNRVQITAEQFATMLSLITQIKQYDHQAANQDSQSEGTASAGVYLPSSG